MSLCCPECGEKSFTIAKYFSKGGTWTRHREKAVYRCSTCGYEETV